MTTHTARHGTTHGTHTAETGTTAQRVWTVLMEDGLAYSVLAPTPEDAVLAVEARLRGRLPGVRWVRVLDEYGNIAA